MELYLALAIPILIGTAWLFTASITRTTLPTLQGKRICLLIAHPDDEAMFFSPTVTALTAPEVGNHVKILCLSSGNADGLGETRKKELAVSAGTLGLRRADDVLVLEDAAFPDSMVQAWPTERIADVLSRAFILPPKQLEIHRGPPKLRRRRLSMYSSPSTRVESLLIRTMRPCFMGQEPGFPG